MFSSDISEIFKNTYFEEHLPTDASINERQQETHALSGTKNESHLAKLSRGQWVLPKITVTWIRCSVVQFYLFGLQIYDGSITR